MAFDFRNRNSFLLSKPTNLFEITLSISKLMKTSARFIGLRALWPLAEQGEGTQRLVAAGAENRTFVIAYTPHARPVPIHMNNLNGSKVEAQWYDASDGTWKVIGQYPKKGT